MIKKLALGASAVALVTASAFAAEPIPAPTPPPAPPTTPAPAPAPPPSFSWSGFYVGLQGGYGFGDKVLTFAGPTEFTVPVAGFLVGAQLGFNAQMGTFVIGAEADWNWSFITGSEVDCPAAGFDCTVDINWLGTATARLGVAFGQILLYAEGGFAFASESFAADDGVDFYVGSLFNLGWTVGGGIELALGTSGWTIDAEYAYMDFGTDLVDPFTDGVTNDPFDLDQALHTVRLGVNMLF